MTALENKKEQKKSSTPRVGWLLACFFPPDSLYYFGPLLAEQDGKGHVGSLLFLEVTLKFNPKRAFVQHISSEGTVFPYSLFVP